MCPKNFFSQEEFIQIKLMMSTDISLIPSCSRDVNIMKRPISLVTGEVPYALQDTLKTFTTEALWGQERYENQWGICVMFQNNHRRL